MSPVRRPGQPPVVNVDVSPAYELLQTIAIVLDGDRDGTYDLDVGWFDEMRRRAGDELLARIGAVSFGEMDTFTELGPLVYDTPAPRDVPAFLDHLRQTDADEIRLHLVQFYSRETRRMTPPAVIRAAVAGDREAKEEFIRTSHPDWEPWSAYLRNVLDADSEAFKAELVDVIEAWADRVWKPESVTIMPILERDAEAKREMLRELPIDRFIPAATNGVEFPPRPGIDRVVMVPSFVRRPVVAFSEFGPVLVIIYPVADESVTAESDAPPLRLLRLSKALGDEKRLRVLRALADGERSLQELADLIGVAKTTMHHHMIVLRSAGLVSTAVGQKRYRLRRESVPDIGALLSGYLGAASGPSAASRAPAGPKRRTGTGG